MHTPITPTRLEVQSELCRRLRSRHLMMITLGGAIGTELFVAPGASIAQAGSDSTLLTYALTGVMVYCLITSLDELAVHLPVSGSLVTYSRLYVEEGSGLALGWNYWFALVVSVAMELVTA